MASSKGRMSVLADGTTVDQEYFQSKNYILAQLEQRKTEGAKSEGEASQSKKENVDKTTRAMLKSGAISEDDGWLLASMELTIRNPFCIANHPAQDQVKFYQKVLTISGIFMFMVAFATICWTWWWGIIIKGGTLPIMPCRGNGGQTFGKVRLCNDTSGKWNTELADDGCDEGAPLSICVEDACVNNMDDDLRNCWYIGAFVMVVFAAYMMLLFRRDQAGKGLLSCACFIEGILGGASTLHYDSSIFLEFFTYLTCACVLALILFTKMSQKNMAEWEKLPNQVGSTTIKTPEVETTVQGVLKKCFYIGGAVVSIVALLWHFAVPTRLTGGSTLAFFIAIITLWLSIGWLIREISWTQHKYDADQFVNMCISFHVDVYCIFILLLLFCIFVLNDSCHQGPVMCLPHCGAALGVQCERFARWGCGVPGKNMSAGTGADGAVATSDGAQSSKKEQSQHVEKEVETEEQWRRRKMINASCAFGILALAGLSFFVPQLSFAVALAICVGLPFYRAVQNKNQDHSNV